MTATAIQSAPASLNLQLFVVPWGTQLHRGEEGFILCPSPTWFNAAMLPALSALVEPGCHVLLGPPGSGKSWLLAHLAEQIEAEGAEVLFVKLGQITSDSDLRRQLFENERYRQWLEGSHRLCVLLDSVDEGVVEVRNIVGALESGFAGAPADRLHLVISCRTAVWPDTLTKFFENTWRRTGRPGETLLLNDGIERLTDMDPPVRVWEIAPLHEEEIREAAASVMLDADVFVRQVVLRRVQSFAEAPLSLLMLLRLFGSEGGLPDRAADLYERGITELCEPSPERSDRRHGGELLPSQRLEVLSAIAAMTLLTGHSGLSIRGDDGAGHGAVARDLLMGLECGRDGSAVTIDMDVLDDVLAHGPLEARGPRVRALSSKSHAEYLAARFLKHAGFRTDEMLRLVSMSNESGTRVAPQLHEVAAWLAGMDDGVQRAILEGEPEILLQSDVEAPGGDFLERLVAALLDRVRSGALSYWDRRSFDALLSRLCHPRLAQQLVPVLQDAKEDDAVTELAISIAERCHLTEAAEAIVAVALDQIRSHHVRKDASYAVVRLGEEQSCRMMRALLQAGDDDPDDDLRGLALRATWCRCLSASELYEAMTPPKRRNYGGAYSGFLMRDLAAEVDEADLLPAVQWAATVPVRDPDGALNMERIAGQLLAKAFSSPSKPDLDHALVVAILARVRGDAPAFYIEKTNVDAWSRGNDIRAVQAMIESDEQRRREIVEHMVQAAEDFDLLRMLHGPSRWVLDEDFGWLLEQATEQEHAGEIDAARRWAYLADLVFRRACESSVTILDLWLCNRERSVVIREAMPYRLAQGIGDPSRLPRLTDPEARKEKLRYVHERRFSDRPRRARSPLVPEGLLESGIEMCETRTALLESLFYNMSFERMRENANHLRPRDATPGWERLSERDRQRVLHIAARYLAENCHRAKEFLMRHSGDGPRYVSDYAPAHAMYLLLKYRPAALDELSADVWGTWTPMVLPIFTNSYVSDDEDREQLIGLVLRNAKPTADRTLLREVDACRESFIPNLLWYYRKLHFIDATLAEALLHSIESKPCPPELVADVVEAVCEVYPSLAIETVSHVLAGPRTEEPDRRRIALCAAAALYAAPALFWPIVWPPVSGDTALATAVLGRLAQRVEFEREADFYSKASVPSLGTMLHWLYEHFGPDSDPVHDGAHSVSDSDALRMLRNRLSNRLTADGSDEAVEALRLLRDKYPQHTWLRDWLLDAERARRQRQWQAVAPMELRLMYAKAHRIADPAARDAAKRFRNLLTAIGTLSKDAPTLVTIAPVISRLWRFQFWRRRYILTLWCQHPAGPHPCCDARGPVQYEFSMPKRWFARVAPALRLCSGLARAALSIGVVPASIGHWVSTFEGQMETMDKLLEQIAPDDGVDLPTEPIAAERVEGEALQAVQALLRQLDPSRRWGGLRAVPQESGEFIWLCGEHYAEAPSKLADRT